MRTAPRTDPRSDDAPVDPAPAARRLGRLLCLPIWLVVVGLLLVVGARLVAFDRLRVFMLADAFTPWIYLPAYAIAVAAACFRFRALAVAAGVLIVAHLAFVLPPVFDTVEIPAAAATSPRLRVVSANLEFNNRDRALIRELSDLDADIIVLQEVTPAWWHAVAVGGLLTSHPHHAEAVRDSSGGMAILSRMPLTRVRTYDIDSFSMITASITAHGQTLQVAGVHPVAPLEVFARHQRQRERITSIVRRLPRPRIVAGDFNATMYNEWMTELEHLGLREAHEAVGRSFAVTWPNGEHLVPPLRIDHIFFDPPLVALRAEEGRGRGSDHRPVVADLAILPDGRPGP